MLQAVNCSWGDCSNPQPKKTDNSSMVYCSHLILKGKRPCKKCTSKRMRFFQDLAKYDWQVMPTKLQSLKEVMIKSKL